MMLPTLCADASCGPHTREHIASECVTLCATHRQDLGLTRLQAKNIVVHLRYDPLSVDARMEAL